VQQRSRTRRGSAGILRPAFLLSYVKRHRISRKPTEHILRATLRAALCSRTVQHNGHHRAASSISKPKRASNWGVNRAESLEAPFNDPHRRKPRTFSSLSFPASQPHAGFHGLRAEEKEKKNDAPLNPPPAAILPDEQRIDQRIGECSAPGSSATSKKTPLPLRRRRDVVNGMWAPPVVGWPNYLTRYQSQRAPRPAGSSRPQQHAHSRRTIRQPCLGLLSVGMYRCGGWSSVVSLRNIPL